MACIYMLLDLEQLQDYMESTCFCTTQDQRRLPLMRRLLIYCICSKISYSSSCPAIPIAYMAETPTILQISHFPAKQQTDAVCAKASLSNPAGVMQPPAQRLCQRCDAHAFHDVRHLVLECPAVQCVSSPAKNTMQLLIYVAASSCGGGTLQELC